MDPEEILELLKSSDWSRDGLSSYFDFYISISSTRKICMLAGWTKTLSFYSFTWEPIWNSDVLSSPIYLNFREELIAEERRYRPIFYDKNMESSSIEFWCLIRDGEFIIRPTLKRSTLLRGEDCSKLMGSSY